MKRETGLKGRKNATISQRVLAYVLALVMVFCVVPCAKVTVQADDTDTTTDITIDLKLEGDLPTVAGASILVNLYATDTMGEVGELVASNIPITFEDGWVLTTTVAVPDPSKFFYIALSDGSASGYLVASFASVETRKVTKLEWVESNTSTHPLGSVNDFTVFALGDFTANNADIEGGLAVRGNFTSTGRSGYVIGMPANKSGSEGANWYSDPNFPIGKAIMPHNPRLIVGGNMHIDQLLNVVGGNVVVSDKEAISFVDPDGWKAVRVWEYLKDGAYDNGTSAQTTDNPDFDLHDWPAVDDDKWVVESDMIASFFDNAEVFLNGLSQRFAAASSDDARTLVYDVAAHDVTNIAAGSKIEILLAPSEEDRTNLSEIDQIVYNLNVPVNSDGVAYLGGIELDLTGFAGDVIVNLRRADGTSGDISFSYAEWSDGEGQKRNGQTHITGTANNFYPNAREYADQIYWNFPTGEGAITTIVTESHQIMGTILAPNSDFVAKTLSNNTAGNVNGFLVAKNIDVSQNAGWEGHHTTNFGNKGLFSLEEKDMYYTAALTLLLEKDPDAVLYDAALQKWVVDVNGMQIESDAATTPNKTVPTVSAGDEVTFAIRVLNQCTIPLMISEIVDYMPKGYTFDPDASVYNNNWKWDETGELLRYIGTPIVLDEENGTKDYEIVYITLTVAEGAGSENLRNFAEISGLMDKDGIKNVEDVDSTPDDDPNNDGTPKDNEVTEDGKNGGDEDDHDFAEVKLGEEPSASPEPSVEPSASPEPSAEPSASPIPSTSPSPTATPRPVSPPRPTLPPASTQSPSPSAKPSPIPSMKPSPSPSPSAAVTETPMPALPSITPIPTMVPVPTVVPAPTDNPVSTQIPMPTGTSMPVETQRPLIVSDQLPNGYVIEQISKDEFVVFDGNGVPLGTVILSAGSTFEDLDILQEMIPFSKPNPQTGDSLPIISCTLLEIIGLGIVVLYIDRQKNRLMTRAK